MDESWMRFPSIYCHKERFPNELLGDSRIQYITYNLSVKEVFMGSKIKPPFICGDIANITYPYLIRG